MKFKRKKAPEEKQKPKDHKKVVKQVTEKKVDAKQPVEKESPKISRIIAEQPRKEEKATPIGVLLPQPYHRFRPWLHVINILALLGMLAVGIGFGRYLEYVQGVQAQRHEIVVQLTKWESVIQKYPNYRDAYVEAASLAYQAGDTKKAVSYINIALALDPNFLPALQLKGILLANKK